MGAKLPITVAGHDIDLYDDYFEHLLVRDQMSNEVIGTYRVLTPTQAKRAGSTYSDIEFDLTRLRSLRERIVELGRSCVHIDHRSGGVILALWGALAEFMARNQLDTMIGCASIPMQTPGISSGHAAASIWRQVKQTHLAPIQYHVTPRLTLPVDRLDSSLNIEPPALIRGYLRLGAKVLGAPAWDPDFNSTSPRSWRFSLSSWRMRWCSAVKGLPMPLCPNCSASNCTSQRLTAVAPRLMSLQTCPMLRS